jgi:choline kinase
MTNGADLESVRAAVLAAGRGVRMGGGLPKTLLPVNGHEPLLHYALAGLKKSGIDNLMVVTGHERSAVEEFVIERWGETNVTFVFNARYASWGNFHSLRVAIDQSPGWELLVVNSDVVVHPDVYRRTATGSGELVLAVEKRRRLDEEDMRIELKANTVRAIGKHIPMRLSAGEFDGVSLLRPAASTLYSNIASDVEWTRRTNIYYEDVYQMMLDKIDARAVFVEPGEYAEVDVPVDMARAEQVIASHLDAWPALELRDSAPDNS